jgi:hypothetical protein
MNMSKFGDERLESIKRQAEETLSRLKLTTEEEQFARHHAEAIYDHVTEAYMSVGGEKFDRMRALSAAAAVAYALIAVNGWR